jgi:membrane-associated phospholipid phosphatase
MHPKIILFILVASVILSELFFLGFFRRFTEPLRSLRLKTVSLVFAAAAACVVSLFFIDPLLVALLQKFTTAFEGIVTFGRTIGKNTYFWYTLLVLYLIPAILRKSSLRRYAFGILVSSAFTALIITALKFIFLRARPSAGAGSLSFFNLEGLTKDMSEFQSFPSGDVSLVAGASFYLFFTVRNAWVRWVFLALPLTTALARIHLNRHWPSDTLASIFIAIFIGFWIEKHTRAAAGRRD